MNLLVPIGLLGLIGLLVLLIIYIHGFVFM